jgi:hypothetical protein
MPKQCAKTYVEQCQSIVQKYTAAGQSWPAAARDIAAWAIRNGHWEVPREKAIAHCAEDLARAMREEYIHDPQGRTVRAKHAARVVEDGEQRVLWADILTASHKHMEVAFQQRRQQIVGDCKQLKTDVDSYNDNVNTEEPIQMVWDFATDLEEAEALQRLRESSENEESVQTPDPLEQLAPEAASSFA